MGNKKKGKSPVRIRVDDRERQSALLNILEKHEHVEVSVERLPVGDYEVEGQLLVERKTLMDLATSIKEGRLFAQLYRLVQADQPGALLLEGTTADLTRSGMRREAIQGAMMQITLFMQLPVLRSLHAEESAYLLLMAARHLDRLQARSNASPRRYQATRMSRREKQQLYVLQGLPGIGLTRARLLLETFGSVQDVLAASEQELRRVPGVGKSTAQNIRWVVEEGEAGYGEVLWDV